MELISGRLMKIQTKTQKFAQGNQIEKMSKMNGQKFAVPFGEREGVGEPNVRSDLMKENVDVDYQR